MTEQEIKLIENFIKRCEKYERVEMKTEVIGAIVKMIYDLWKEEQNGKE